MCLSMRDRPQTVGQMPGCFTEKYILHRRAYEKTHSAIPGSRRLHFSVTLRCPGSVGQPPARLRGTLENSPTGQMRSNNRPPGCGAGCSRVANLSLGFDLTEKRTLAPIPHGKALFGETHKQNALFPSRYGHRMRLCVSLELQSAPFREMCFSSPGQTSGHFTEKRTLAAAPHGKAHFEPRPSRLETPRRCGRVHLDSFVQHD